MLNQPYTHLDSYIEPLLKRVLEAKLGICCGTIHVDSSSSSYNKAGGDRFKLSIPYAKHTVTWDVFFDSQRPELGPDFIFNDDTFLTDMNIDTLFAKVPSLAKWNVNDEDALLKVLIELLLCYKHHQIELLQKQERLNMEYSVLMNSTEIAQEEIEMILLPFGSKPTEAKFLMNLPINVSQLGHQPFKSEKDMAMLLVTFYGPHWNRITSQIFLSKYLEHILNESLQLPRYLPDKLLTDYVMELKKNIEEKIKFLAQIVEKRRLFMETMHVLLPNSVLQYDTAEFYYIVILLDEEDFKFLVNIQLPPNFPSNKPVITVQSVCVMIHNQRMYKEKIVNFKYSPTWTPLDMVDEILKSIKIRVVKFKEKSLQLCS